MVQNGEHSTMNPNQIIEEGTFIVIKAITNTFHCTNKNIIIREIILTIWFPNCELKTDQANGFITLVVWCATLDVWTIEDCSL